jgi:hypothetical protein
MTFNLCFERGKKSLLSVTYINGSTIFTAVLCGVQINTKLTGHFRCNNRENLYNSITAPKMKLLAVVLVVALR